MSVWLNIKKISFWFCALCVYNVIIFWTADFIYQLLNSEMVDYILPVLWSNREHFVVSLFLQTRSIIQMYKFYRFDFSINFVMCMDSLLY
jgi:hypothetical protein